MNTFEEKLKATVLATAFQEEKRMKKKVIRVILSCAVACVIVLFALPSQPEDTYDDPELAYAELEKAFSMIADNFEKGSEIIIKAEEPINKLNELLK